MQNLEKRIAALNGKAVTAEEINALIAKLKTELSDETSGRTAPPECSPAPNQLAMEL